MLRNTTIFVSAPDKAKARAMSNSQFVPGKTGSNTFGFAFEGITFGIDFLASIKD